MSTMLRLPELALGELERDVLEALWDRGPLNPMAVHEHLGRDITVNTVSSALKRLCEKGLLERDKVSHAYVYRAAVTRTELQREMIGAIAHQFGDVDSPAFFAAFVGLAEECGEEALRRLEQLIADRLKGDGA